MKNPKFFWEEKWFKVIVSFLFSMLASMVANVLTNWLFYKKDSFFYGFYNRLLY